MTCKLIGISLLLCASVALAEPQPSIDAGQTTANVFESTYFHFRYELPKGWFALDDRVRLTDNKKRNDTQRQEALKNKQPNTSTQTTEIDVFTPYNLLIASRTAVNSSETGQLPRVEIHAIKRFSMMMEAADSAKLIAQIMRPKVLRGPEDIILSGHKFVRADFQFKPDSFLSKFTSVSGDYLIEFELRAENEKDLRDLANTVLAIQFY